MNRELADNSYAHREAIPELWERFKDSEEAKLNLSIFGMTDCCGMCTKMRIKRVFYDPANSITSCLTITVWPVKLGNVA